MFEQEHFIRTYNNIIDPNTLDEIMKIASISDKKVRGRGGFNVRNNGTVVDNQILLEPFYSQIAVAVSDAIFNKMLSPYMQEFYFIKDIDADWYNGCTLLQKTPPAGGYHRFHTENVGYKNATRSLVWMIYLNDIEEGGETEFPLQHKRIKPRRNMGVMWPGGVTHFHRGLPPYSNEKLILTGWLATCNDIMTYRVENVHQHPGQQQPRKA